MECSKISGRFLKVKAKVSGFLIAKIEKRNTPEIKKYDLEKTLVTIKSKKNTITGLSYLLNAFQRYMSGASYLGATASSSGIVITTTTGQTYTLSFSIPPGASATENSAIVSFTVMDDSANSYTATSEQLITTSAGYNIPIATANLSVTKNSDEILTLTWIITITISPSPGIIYIPTTTRQPGGWGCSSFYGNCGACVESSANSLLPTQWNGCTPSGLSSQYTQTSFVTTQLFTDIFYNTYGAGSSNSFTSYVSTTLYIYTLYCMEYFAVGPVNFTSYQNGTSCFTGGSGVNPIYVQVYIPTVSEPYMGVQIEFTT
jgi:hypothetical protein